MKKIAILTCLRSNDVCTRAGCLDAFWHKKAHFSDYGDEKLELIALYSCNGCGDVKMKNQDGLNEKIERIVNMKTDVVHVGVCTVMINRNDESKPKKYLCPMIASIIEQLKKHDIKIVYGTHQ